jgi:hypothetical protein
MTVELTRLRCFLFSLWGHLGRTGLSGYSARSKLVPSDIIFNRSVFIFDLRLHLFASGWLSR